MDDLRRLSVDDLTDEEIEAVLNTRGFRKMLAYQRLAEGIQVLSEEDEIYDSLVNSILKQHSSVSTEGSIRECLRLFREEVETFTEPLVSTADGETTEVDLESLYVEDEDPEEAEV